MIGPLAYLDGKFIPRHEARLPIHDTGLIFGAAVTDFCRTFLHRLFRWPEHLARFRRDCDACFIPVNLSENELSAVAEELVVHNARMIGPNEELALISFATPGPFGFYADTPLPEVQPTLCLHTAILRFALSLVLHGRNRPRHPRLARRRAR